MLSKFSDNISLDSGLESPVRDRRRTDQVALVAVDMDAKWGDIEELRKGASLRDRHIWLRYYQTEGWPSRMP
jgi:hypothetical protein